MGTESTPEDRGRALSPVTRRAVIGGGLGATVLTAAGAAAAGVSYRETARWRAAAGAAQHRARMPTTTRVLWRPRTQERVVALTFDDGPDPRTTPQVLDVLARAGATATFFVVGQRAAARPDLVRRALEEGHEIGNHSWRHADLTTLAPAKVQSDLSRTNDVIGALTGAPSTVLRPPYGRLSGAVLEAAAGLGMDVALWEQRLQVRERDVDGNVAWVREHLGPGLVLLCHDGGPMAQRIGIEALPQILRETKDQGFRFIGAREAFALDTTPGQA